MSVGVTLFTKCFPSLRESGEKYCPICLMSSDCCSGGVCPSVLQETTQFPPPEGLQVVARQSGTARSTNTGEIVPEPFHPLDEDLSDPNPPLAENLPAPNPLAVVEKVSLNCQVCGKTFKNTDSKSKHMQGHKSEEHGPKCPICGVRASRKDNLKGNIAKQHNLIHQNIDQVR
ncbi:unnamed protein product [Allacma fusca]|uniref:C2H2-type domain-containing protein n=1 Tax=Allacma fusca TaxID=39272 RepID=A0A8J2LA25_9HEXA|nr:unnamed protein product [Allacma fusca]